jgi:uncharacterized protein DUF3300
MKAIARLRILGIASLMLVFAPGAAAQDEAASGFSAAQLEQMAAPIALYPDSLVSQILMASTYPLEIVEAGRWSEKNAGLKDKKLEEALKDQDWDASVKSLCGFPDVLKRMNENLDWTQDLGDAFLGQKADVLDAVQRMRGKAHAAGNLKTTEQQVVTQQPDKIIVIQPADPQVIYVPTYSPTVVYGAWHYPTYYYPPMYVAPPPGYGMMAFAVGVAWGSAVWGNTNWGWGHGDVDIDINRYNNFNKNTNINADRTNINNKSGKANWNHKPEHRGGVNYRNNKTAQQFGAQGGSNRVTRDQSRGYDRAGASNRQASQRPSATTGAAGNRQPSASTRDTGATQRPSSNASARNTGASQRPSAGASNYSRGGGGSSAFSGSRNAGMDRSASSRGSASRGGGGARRR